MLYVYGELRDKYDCWSNADSFGPARRRYDYVGVHELYVALRVERVDLCEHRRTGNSRAGPDVPTGQCNLDRDYHVGAATKVLNPLREINSTLKVGLVGCDAMNLS